MRLLRKGCLVLVIAHALVARAASGPTLHVSLQVSPSTTLAGLPVSLHFVFSNTGGSAVSIPKQAVLLVRDARDGDFLAHCDVGRFVMSPDWPMISVSAGKTVTADLETDGSFFKPAWFLDSRLLASGTYDLQVFFGDALTNDLTADEIRARSVASTPAVLTVTEPTGSDLTVWHLLTGLGQPWGPLRVLTPAAAPVVRRIMTDFPSSAYGGWLATTGIAGSAEDRAELLRQWLARDVPNDPYLEWRQLKLAILDIAVWDQFERTDPAKSRDHGAKARVTLNKLAQQTKNETIKRIVADRLDYLNDDDGQ